MGALHKRNLGFKIDSNGCKEEKYVHSIFLAIIFYNEKRKRRKGSLKSQSPIGTYFVLNNGVSKPNIMVISGLIHTESTYVLY